MRGHTRASCYAPRAEDAVTSLQTIRQKLEQLGTLDPQKQRFGASKHNTS